MEVKWNKIEPGPLRHYARYEAEGYPRIVDYGEEFNVYRFEVSFPIANRLKYRSISFGSFEDAKEYAEKHPLTNGYYIAPKAI